VNSPPGSAIGTRRVRHPHEDGRRVREHAETSRGLDALALVGVATLEVPQEHGRGAQRPEHAADGGRHGTPRLARLELGRAEQAHAPRHAAHPQVDPPLEPQPRWRVLVAERRLGGVGRIGVDLHADLARLAAEDTANEVAEAECAVGETEQCRPPLLERRRHDDRAVDRDVHQEAGLPVAIDLLDQRHRRRGRSDARVASTIHHRAAQRFARHVEAEGGEVAAVARLDHDDRVVLLVRVRGERAEPGTARPRGSRAKASSDAASGKRRE
jgi:hypothetical protein